MNENDYHAAALSLFAEIESLLDKQDADFDNNGEVVEIVGDNGDKIIINKQTPMREIWIASKDGGKHFRFCDGQWQDTRTQAELLDYLAGLLRQL